jgi:hypothetical protein
VVGRCEARISAVESQRDVGALVIVSHRHRFIFIKTRKTAGTSIEIVLSRYCGPDDILTTDSTEDERLRQEIGGVGPQNHTGPIYRHEPKDIARILLRRRPERRPLYWRHMGAHHLRRLLGPEIWDSYYKFAFERNPWDKVVSAYYWRHRKSLDASGDPPITFGEYVRKGKKLINVDGYEQYSIGDKVAVDLVGKFEALQSDLTQALDTIGIDYDGWMPSTKSATRKIRSYREFYGDEERELVAGYFHREIELLGYEF